MATRYGKLPSEILGLTLEEFSLNHAVFSLGIKYEASCRKGRPMALSGSGDDGGLPDKLDAIFGRVNSRRNIPKRRRGNG